MIRQNSLFIIIIFIIFLSSCKNNRESLGENLPDNFTFVDSNLVGFVLPENSITMHAEIYNAIKEMNPNLIYLAKLDTNNNYSPLFSVCKFVGETKTPMEIIFIENAVKYSSELLGDKSTLINFGVFEKDGKLFRYKVTKPPMERIIKIIYYFMKNDKDENFYELSISTDLEHLSYSDSIITNIAESFTFLK